MKIFKFKIQISENVPPILLAVPAKFTENFPVDFKKYGRKFDKLATIFMGFCCNKLYDGSTVNQKFLNELLQNNLIKIGKNSAIIPTKFGVSLGQKFMSDFDSFREQFQYTPKNKFSQKCTPSNPKSKS